MLLCLISLSAWNAGRPCMRRAQNATVRTACASSVATTTTKSFVEQNMVLGAQAGVLTSVAGACLLGASDSCSCCDRTRALSSMQAMHPCLRPQSRHLSSPQSRHLSTDCKATGSLWGQAEAWHVYDCRKNISFTGCDPLGSLLIRYTCGIAINELIHESMTYVRIDSN